MDLRFNTYNSEQTKEYNNWHLSDREKGFNGFDKFVVLQGSLLGDYLEFIDCEIDDITIESVYIGDSLVGFIGYSMQSDTHLHVEILGINPDFRGREIASELLKAFKAKMKSEQNIERFTLSVREDNEPGIASFSKVGKKIDNKKKENYIDFEL